MDFLKCIKFCPLLRRLGPLKIEVTALINRKAHEQKACPGAVLYFDNVQLAPDDEDAFGACMFFKESLEPLVMYGAIQGEVEQIGEDLMRLSVSSPEDLANALKSFTLTECELCGKCPNVTGND